MPRALPVVEATFDSFCELCEGRVHEGEDIARLPDEDGGEWVHATCAEREGYEVDAP